MVILSKHLYLIPAKTDSLHQFHFIMSSRRIGQELIGKGKWLALQKLKYVIAPKDQVHEWETVVRLSAEDGSQKPIGDVKSNVVVMVAVKDDDEVLLVKQYRPSVDAMTLEMPAGLIDLGETGAEAAERELLEETGHKSEGLMRLSLPVASDPGLTNVGMLVAEMKASKDRDETRMDPRDRLRIETTSVHIDKLRDYLDTQLKSGVLVDSRLYHFALGIEYGKRRQ